MKSLGEIPVMKTTTIELTPEALAAFINLVNAGVLNERLGGIQVWGFQKLVMPLLENAQMALSEPAPEASAEIEEPT